MGTPRECCHRLRSRRRSVRWDLKLGAGVHRGRANISVFFKWGLAVSERRSRPLQCGHGGFASFLWRNIIPEPEGCGRVIAPDLIGQGDSDKLPASEGPGRYSFEAAFDYLDGLLRSIGADQNVTLVIHDWGSGLGFHWARLGADQNVIHRRG